MESPKRHQTVTKTEPPRRHQHVAKTGTKLKPSNQRKTPKWTKLGNPQTPDKTRKTRFLRSLTRTRDATNQETCQFTDPRKAHKTVPTPCTDETKTTGMAPDKRSNGQTAAAAAPCEKAPANHSEKSTPAQKPLPRMAKNYGTKSQTFLDKISQTFWTKGTGFLFKKRLELFRL